MFPITALLASSSRVQRSTLVRVFPLSVGALCCGRMLPVRVSSSEWKRSLEQQIARKLVNGSEHLGQDNVEVLSNSVSSRSNKLTAFNTIFKGIELFCLWVR